MALITQPLYCFFDGWNRISAAQLSNHLEKQSLYCTVNSEAVHSRRTTLFVGTMTLWRGIQMQYI